MSYQGLTIADKDALIEAKGRNGWRVFLDSVGYMVEIDTALAQIAEMEREQKTRTNQDALLEKWRDAREMAIDTVPWNEYYGWSYHITQDGRAIRVYTQNHELAVKKEITWLLSPAEDGK